MGPAGPGQGPGSGDLLDRGKAAGTVIAAALA